MTTIDLTRDPAGAEPAAEAGAVRRPVDETRARRSWTMAAGAGWEVTLSWTLAVVAGLAAWLMLFLGPLSALYEGHEQAVLYSQFRNQLASGTTPPPPFAPNSVLQDGDPVAVLSVPDAGIHNVVVVEGSRSADLERGPGHLPGTVLPGEAGVSTILGRAFGYGGPFGDLHGLHTGELISTTTGQGVSKFRIVDIRNPGDPIPGSLGQAASRLTLVTAANRGWRNLWVPTHATYVDAVLVGKASPVAPGSPVLASDAPMKGDAGSLEVLVLWLQLLLVVVVLTVFAAVRWSRRQTWLVAAPVLFAVLWGASLEFTQLLPNLL